MHGRSTGRVLLAIIVIAAAVGVGWWVLRPGPRIAILGDSITVVSAGSIRSTLSHEYDADIRATLGVTAGQMLPAAQEALAHNPDQVVIALGSNDALHGTPPATAAADIGKLVALFPQAHCIHLVTLNTHMTDNGRSVAGPAELLNAAIVHLQSTDPRIHLIDWNKAVSDDIAAHPPGGTLLADTVHPNAAGQAVFANQIKAALDSCLH